MIPQLWENKHLPYWLLLWSCSSGRPSTLHYSIFPQCNWWLSWLEISCWKEETLKGRQLPAETSRGTWKSCLNGISAWRAFEGWRQIPVYLSFLEVIHIGGFLANQPKNIQWSIRFQRKSKASFSASLGSVLRTATLQTCSRWIPQSAGLISTAPGDLQDTDKGFVISFSRQFPPSSLSSLLTGRYVFCPPKFFPPKKWPCASEVVCCVESWQTALGVSW